MTAIRKEVVIGDCRLLLGDCLEILPTLGKVDAVVTDIPYQISQKSNGLRRLDYGSWDGDGATETAFAALDLLSATPSVVAWCSAEQISKLHDRYPDRQRRTLVWIKPNPPVLNGQHLFLSSQELGFYGKRDAAWFGGSCVRSYWHGPAPMERQHPTQKPVELMCWTVSNTVPPAGMCCDPFMGSGTTGVASVKLGRKFIGIEIDEGYFDIAVERIRKAYAQPDFFVEQTKAPEPKQEALFGESAA